MTLKRRWAELIVKWSGEAETLQRRHELLAGRYYRWHMLLGIPTVIITGGTGTTVFAGLTDDSYFMMRILTGSIAMLGAILAAVQAFMKLAGTSEKHANAAKRCRALVKELDYSKAFPPTTKEEIQRNYEMIKRGFSDIPATASFPPDAPGELRRRLELASSIMSVAFLMGICVSVVLVSIFVGKVAAVLSGVTALLGIGCLALWYLVFRGKERQLHIDDIELEASGLQSLVDRFQVEFNQELSKESL